MPVLTLDYRHCDRKRPKFIKHIEIEAIAAQARQQLVGVGVDAIAFDDLRQIDRLKINSIDFALEVSTECEVHDEDGNHVFGICEYDPAVPDTAMVCVSPVGEKLSELLALSTLAHELGHAVFDAPGWIMDGSKGPGLFDAFEPCGQREEYEPRAKKRGWRVTERGMKMFRDLGWGYTAATEGKA